MRLFKLTRRGAIGWDEYDSKVVIANDYDHARELANQNTGNEGQIWDDWRKVKCIQVYIEGEARVVLESFNAS